ncbi:MAG: RAMP superfamily CRISPR-associated protein, partial [Anaerolineae bacterium]|nr:RAMP superfamily CRISPR-associated protein [Anaerolineae bacterium]
SMVQTFDAFPLFFPVPSMLGPVWVTAPERLKELVQSGALEPKDVDIGLKPEHGFRLQTGLRSRRLNLGWLLLPVAVPNPPLTPSGVARLKAANVPEEILSRLVLVPDELFAQVVNNNLEVRTSTAIDRSTGAALSGALYTYEAIPRTTLFSFQVVYKNPRDFLLDGQPIPQDIAWVQTQVEKGLHYIEYLGIGAKNSRGMGRLRVLNLEVQ